jgi:hypothetical protein
MAAALLYLSKMFEKSIANGRSVGHRDQAWQSGADARKNSDRRVSTIEFKTFFPSRRFEPQ